jgi:predicted membrane-bound spermidine synthase
MEIKSASLFAGLLLLLIPVFCMGLTSPIISAWLTENQTDKTSDKSGNFAGIVYGIGTLSGVSFTLICLFLLMPTIGVNFTVIVLGIMLILASVLSYFFIQKAK